MRASVLGRRAAASSGCPAVLASARQPRVRSPRNRPLVRVVACRAEADAAGQRQQQQPPRGGGILQRDPVQLAQLLVQLADLSLRPHAQYVHDLLHVLQPRLAELPSGELAGCLQVLGAWQFAPGHEWLAAYSAAVRRQLAAGGLGLRDIATIVWGLTQLQNPAQPLLDDLLEAAHGILAEHAAAAAAPPAGGSSSSTAAASEQQEQQPHQRQHEGGLDPSALADLLWAAAKLSHSPGDAWLAACVAASQPLLGSFTPRQLAQVVWALARLPWQPPPAWCEAFLGAVGAGLGAFDAASISLTAWGLATLKLRPGPRFLFAFERRAEAVIGSLAAHELACTLWALSELKRKRPYELRLARLLRRQTSFLSVDFELLAAPRLFKVVRALTVAPHKRGGGGGK